MSFLNNLKVAVLNKNLNALQELSNKNFEYNSIEEANEMLKYIIEAKKILEEEKMNIKSKMKKIKKLKEFYNYPLQKNISGFSA